MGRPVRRPWQESRSNDTGELDQGSGRGAETNALKVEAAWLAVVLDVGYDRILNNSQVLLLRHWGFHYGDANG